MCVSHACAPRAAAAKPHICLARLSRDQLVHHLYTRKRAEEDLRRIQASLADARNELARVARIRNFFRRGTRHAAVDLNEVIGKVTC